MIPKVDNPERVAQFRQISLCNVVYKVISKVLSNRLRVILPEIISHHQNAFVPGRLITDNILLAYECIHTMKKKKGKRGLCAVKLDMHKAYDRLEWSFLEKIMSKLGFDQRWIKIIMACVSSVRYKVRFNSCETDSFSPTRGLRQVRMATGWVWIGWSLRAPKIETRSRNPNPNRTLIRVEIHHQNQTRGYPKLEQIPKTRMDTRNP
jgi:hypothetical protein